MSTDEVKEFYEHDGVYKFDNEKIIFGMVTDSYNNLESDDLDLHRGQIRISWLNNLDGTEVCNQDTVTLMSRNIRPGLIVTRLGRGKVSQPGYCRVSTQNATVKIVGTDIVIENVPFDRLVKSSNVQYDTPVYLDNNIGRVLNYEEKITLQSKCGSSVEIWASLETQIKEDTEESRRVVDYNVGQRVKAIPSRFTGPKWKKKTPWMKSDTYQSFTVQKVGFTNIEVIWLEYKKDGAKYFINTIKDEDIPRLILLETVENNILEQSSQRLLKIYTSDIKISERNWIMKQSAMRRPKESKNQEMHYCVETNPRSNKKIKLSSNGEGMKNLKKTEDYDWSTDGDSDESNLHRKYYPRSAKQLVPVSEQTALVEVLCTDSKATIVWQDGTVENDIPTTELYHFTSCDNHEFFPGHYVVLKDKLESEKYGIVQKVDHLERTAFIKWFTYSEGDKEPVFDCMNEMSVYDIMKHPKFTFHPGYEVYSKSIQEKGLGTVIDSHTNGRISVKWLSGLEKQCWPQDIEQLLFNDAHDSSHSTIVQMPWEIDGPDYIAPRITYEPMLRDMAMKCDTLKKKVDCLKQCFRGLTNNEILIVFGDILNDTFFNILKSQRIHSVLNVLRESIETQVEPLASEDYQTNEATSSEIENINTHNMPIDNVKENEEYNNLIQVTVLLEEENFTWFLHGLEKYLDEAHSDILRVLRHVVSSIISEASAGEAMPTSHMPVPSSPMTPEDSLTSLTSTPPKPTLEATECEIYSCLDEAPIFHRFYNSKIEPTDIQKFFQRIVKEHNVLQESLPPGIWVRTYSNRLDLMSIMIAGPNGTPYEDGLFLFDIQLSADYPISPPLVNYISYSKESLNPNLFVEGRVCVSLLGTWSGDSTEVWGPHSTLLQLMVSIQGLILVPEPYYNEAGFEKQRGSEEGYKFSRTYNELVMLTLIRSLSEMLMKAPNVFKQEILQHFMENGEKMCKRLKTLINDDEPPMPDFPLLPVSKGLKFSLNKALDFFMATLTKVLTNNK